MQRIVQTEQPSVQKPYLAWNLSYPSTFHRLLAPAAQPRSVMMEETRPVHPICPLAALQLCTDLDKMPVEDACVPWPEAESSYVAVARLVLPAQDAYSPARQAYFDEVLSFQPAHALHAHRPLGSVMRARLATYHALSAYRHEQNHWKQVKPSGVDQVPD